MKKVTQLVTSSFNAGLWMAIACMSLYQDSVGQIGMLHRVQSHWIDPKYTIPAALIGFVVSLGLSIHATSQARKIDEGREALLRLRARSQAEKAAFDRINNRRKTGNDAGND